MLTPVCLLNSSDSGRISEITQPPHHIDRVLFPPDATIPQSFAQSSPQNPVALIRAAWHTRLCSAPAAVHWLHQYIDSDLRTRWQMVSSHASTAMKNSTFASTIHAAQHAYSALLHHANEVHLDIEAPSEIPLWEAMRTQVPGWLRALKDIALEEDNEREETEKEIVRHRRAVSNTSSTESLLEPTDRPADYSNDANTRARLRDKHGETPYWPIIESEINQYPHHITHLEGMLQKLVKTKKGNGSISRAIHRAKATLSHQPYKPKACDYYCVQFVLANRLALGEHPSGNPYHPGLVNALASLSSNFRKEEKKWLKAANLRQAHTMSPFQKQVLDAIKTSFPAPLPMSATLTLMLKYGIELTPARVNALLSAKSQLPALASLLYEAYEKYLHAQLGIGNDPVRPIHELFEPDAIHRTITALARIQHIHNPNTLDHAQKGIVRWLTTLSPAARDHRWIELMHDPEGEMNHRSLGAPRVLPTEPVSSDTRSTLDDIQERMLTVLDPALRPEFIEALAELKRKGADTLEIAGVLLARPELAIDIARAAPADPASTRIWMHQFLHLAMQPNAETQLAFLLGISVHRLTTESNTVVESAKNLLRTSYGEISNAVDRALRGAGKYAGELASMFIRIGNEKYTQAENRNLMPDISLVFMRYIAMQPADYWPNLLPSTRLSGQNTAFEAVLDHAFKERLTQNVQQLSVQIGHYLSEIDPIFSEKRWLALMGADPLSQSLPQPIGADPITNPQLSLDQAALQNVPTAYRAAVQQALAQLEAAQKLNAHTRAIVVAAPEFAEALCTALLIATPETLVTLKNNVVFARQNAQALEQLAGFLKIASDTPGYLQFSATLAARAATPRAAIENLRREFTQTHTLQPILPAETTSMAASHRKRTRPDRVYPTTGEYAPDTATDKPLVVCCPRRAAAPISRDSNAGAPPFSKQRTSREGSPDFLPRQQPRQSPSAAHQIVKSHRAQSRNIIL